MVSSPCHRSAAEGRLRAPTIRSQPDGEVLVLSITVPVSAGCITCLRPRAATRMSVRFIQATIRADTGELIMRTVLALISALAVTVALPIAGHASGSGEAPRGSGEPPRGSGGEGA